MERDELAVGLAVAAGVALLVVVASVVAAPLFSTPTLDADEDAATGEPPPEYRPESVVADPIASSGTVQVNRSLHAGSYDRKVVLIESASRTEQEEIRPFVRSVVAAGHEIRYTGGSLEEELAGADAYVLVDPGTSLSGEERRAVANFTDRGGRLLLIGEPNRREIQTGLFTAQISTVRTQMVELAAQYGIVFGNRYLYDTTTNDGNFRNVLARPTNAFDGPEVDRIVLGTATRVEARNGTVLLRTPRSTRLSNDGDNDAYPVAVRTGNVIAVGDTTFLHEGRHNVADNEAFVAYLTEFALRGDAAKADAPEATGDEEDTPTPTEATEGAQPPGPNGTVTPTPLPPPNGTQSETPVADGSGDE